MPASSVNDAGTEGLLTLRALVERIYPETDWGPGAAELGVAESIMQHLDSPFGRNDDAYRQAPFDPNAHRSMGWQGSHSREEVLANGLRGLEQWSTRTYGMSFSALASSVQEQVMGEIEEGRSNAFDPTRGFEFFDLLVDQVFTALFITPTLGDYRLHSAWTRLER